MTTQRHTSLRVLGRHKLLSLSLGLAWMVLAACADFAPDAAGANYCQSDDDCGGTFLCVYGACYDPASASLQRLAFEIRPSTTSGLPNQQIDDFVVSSQMRSQLWLRSGVQVYFAIRDPSNQAISGTLTATATSLIPGKSNRAEGHAGADGLVDLKLNQGLGYSLRFVPDDSSLAPLVPEPIFVNADIAGNANRIQITAPGPEALRTVSGRVVFSQNNPNPIPGLRVQLRGLAGSPPAWQVVSSTQITSDTEDQRGRFTLSVPTTSSAGLQLHIAPSDGNPFVPVVTVDSIHLDQDVDLGDVEIGDIGSPLPVSGVVRGPNGPVVAAMVHFVGSVGAGQFSGVALTDSQGTYRLDLLPGEYQAAVQAPSTDDAGLSGTTSPVVIDTAPRGQSVVDFVAPQKASLQGLLMDSQGNTVARALLRATRLGNIDESQDHPSADLYSVAESRSDSQGQYQLKLDSGLYQLEVIPSAETLAPWRSDVLAIGAQNQVHDITLFAPAPFGGQVLAEDNSAPISSALLRAYLILDTNQAVMLGEQVSDENGDFAMVLPQFSLEAQP